MDLRPYATEDTDFWVFSDLTPGLDSHVAPMRSDFVLGLSSASSTLAQLTIRRPVASALDLGTGCSVQTLHLATHAQSITATDVNSRALELAQLTLTLNGVEAELLNGSLYAPVRDRRFDLITTNPPYVMSPPRTGEARLAYRETGYVGDELMEHLVRNAADHLNPDGTCQILGNWAHRAGQPWDERLAGWVAGSGLDAHVVQREVLEVPAYVELWLADAGLTGSPDYRHRYAEWLDYFAGARHRGGRHGLAAAHPGRPRRPVAPVRGLAVRRRAADRPGPRRRSRVDQRLAAARRHDSWPAPGP